MYTILAEQIKKRYDQVFARIERAKNLSDSSSRSVKLVVVTKQQNLEVIKAATEAGVMDFGENYVEEAFEKINATRNYFNGHWHMIGHVQSRKAEIVARNFDYIHSVDSVKLAVRLNRFAMEANRILPILIECNVSGEASKFGFPIYEQVYSEKSTEEILEISQLSNLELRGLMTMPPFFDNPELSRPYFKKLKHYQELLQHDLSLNNFGELSMGTSTDFEIGVEEGATIVRIGTAILGARAQKLT